MKIRIAMIPVLILLAVPAGGHAFITLLDAHFDDITPDVPIGTGGAAVGEPISVSNISAFVSNFCFGSPCLTISDNSQFTGRVTFDHLLGRELDQGTIVVQFELAVDGDPPPSFRILDKDGQGLAQISFLSLPRHIYVTDGTGTHYAAPYATVDLMTFQYVIYYPDGYYDLYIDNDLVVQNLPLITSQGVTTIQFYDGDSDSGGFMMIDNIKIIDLDESYTSVPNAGYDVPSNWGEVKKLFR